MLYLAQITFTFSTPFRPNLELELHLKHTLLPASHLASAQQPDGAGAKRPEEFRSLGP